jgi:hypothetical protein
MVIVYFQRDFFPGKACLVDYPDPIAEPFDGLIVNLYLPHPLTLILSPGGERKPGKEVLLLLNAPFYTRWALPTLVVILIYLTPSP